MPEARRGDRQPPYFNQKWMSETWLDELSMRDKSVGKYTFVQISDKIFFRQGRIYVLCGIHKPKNEMMIKPFTFTLLALFLCFLWLSCNSSSSQKEAELAQRERELIAKENELLKKENERLKQQTLQEKENASQNLNILIPGVLAGTWDVTMNCIGSDCQKIKKGDIYTEAWQIDVVDNKVVVKVSNSILNVREYKGELIDNTLSLKSSRLAFMSSGKATVNVTVKGLNQMVGSREVLRGSGSSICKIDYSVVLNRKIPLIKF